MDLDKAYAATIQAYKKMGNDYLEKNNVLIPLELNDFLETVVPGGKILDVGCAGGRDSKVMTAKGFRVVGIDVVDEFLEEARKYASEAEFIHQDLLELDFPENSFDGVWASAVLVHAKKEDVPRALGNFYRVLKPGGALFIMVKRGEGFSFDTDKLSGEKRLMVYFSEEEMKEFVEKAGFSIEDFNIVDDDAGREEIKWIRIIARKAG